MTTTWATCFMDLEDWDRFDTVEKRPRSLDEYMVHASTLLKTDIPLVVFTQAKMLPRLLSIRPGRCTSAFGTPFTEAGVRSDDPIEYRVVEFDRLPLFPCWSRLRRTFAEDYRGKNRINDAKDTPGYLILQNSKWDFVDLASRESSTSHIGWVDIGLAHCNRELSRLRSITDAPPDDLTVCMEYPGAPPPPLDEIPRRWWGRIMFGLWTIPRSLVTEYHGVCTQAFRSLVMDGYYPFENEVLYWLLNTQPERLPKPRVYQAAVAQMVSRFPLRGTIEE